MSTADAERRRSAAINDAAAAAGMLRVALEGQVTATSAPDTLQRTAATVLQRVATLFPGAVERRAFLAQHLNLALARRQLVEALAVLDSISSQVAAMGQPGPQKSGEVQL